ncbi:uncharacterized protein DUF4861 [Mariniflexile fucanivorans]|uniref:Uncharacterized protein DUF4861 n=1 Tax=Mariniflexile fucanivorans TaxID=264023 RepID=A0A4R1RIB9_9FLAO|nr:DUF4861 family protein [Mariniflexile fucanivorans]TCL65392.1 uncharacterized protein DUF4861 [Mariniflexile fucanivorans]
MKNIVIITLFIFTLFSCKEKKTDSIKNTLNDNVEVKLAHKTYAEISIAQGGDWVDGSRGHKEYSAGTSFKNVDELQVPSEHTDHTWFLRYEGPGWENNQIGYRLYLDWRNAIDIFGKKVDSLVLPYVGQDGFDSYHEPSPWGQDILKAGKSMGIGSFGRIVADTVVHFQSVKNTFAKIDNTDNNSSVNIRYQGWESGNESIDLNTKLTIYPQDRYTKSELTPSKEIAGICTGIVKFKEIPLIKKEEKKWAYIATYGKQTLASPPDNLGMALFYNLEDVAEQKTGVDDHLVIFKPTIKPITYYFLGAWEQEQNGIKTQEAFIQDLNTKLEALDNTNILK